MPRVSLGPTRHYTHRWRSAIGHHTIQQIVISSITEWKDGLRDWQLGLVSRVLDGEDALLSTATGDGKSAIFIIPIFVLLEMKAHPSLYPDLPTYKFPMGIVVAPTKGLAANMVR